MIVLTNQTKAERFLWEWMADGTDDHWWHCNKIESRYIASQRPLCASWQVAVDVREVMFAAAFRKHRHRHQSEVLLRKKVPFGVVAFSSISTHHPQFARSEQCWAEHSANLHSRRVLQQVANCCPFPLGESFSDFGEGPILLQPKGLRSCQNAATIPVFQQVTWQWLKIMVPITNANDPQKRSCLVWKPSILGGLIILISRIIESTPHTHPHCTPHHTHMNNEDGM